jgi:ATP/maltotriose-dependent transcriptional regulator MalT
MDFPATDDTTDSYSAVQLFVERARRVRRGFVLSDERRGVNRVCRTLQGMPLAIELAASWTKTMTCIEIAGEIQRNVDFLTTNLRDVPERHRSMHAVFSQSWNLLSDEECGVFMKLSIFRGGFRREAAQQVAGASLDTLTSLVEKSLLVWVHDGRYQIHELLRQYAEQKLTEFAGDLKQVRDDHSAYYINFIAEHDAAIQGGAQIQAKAELEAELENIRVAWRWAAEQVNVEAVQTAAQALGLFYHFTSRYREAADAFARATRSLESTGQDCVALALSLSNEGWFALRLGQIEKALLVLERSHSIYQRLNTAPVARFGADPLAPLCIVAVVSGEYAHATQLGEQARRECEARGDKYNLLAAYYALAGAALAQGDYLAAKQAAEKACAIAQEVKNDYIMGYCLIELGNASLALGNYSDAQRHYEACYALREAFNDPEGMALALYRLGKVAWLQGDHHEAKRRYQRSLTLYQDLGDQGGLANALVGLGIVACVLGEFLEARQYFRRALQTALDAHLLPLALSILANIGELFVETGQQDRGIGLFTFAFHHPASDYGTKERAQQFLSRLSPDRLSEHVPDDLLTVTASLFNELSAAEDATVSEPRVPVNSALFDALGERELEILQLVAAGLTNREIADRLVLAVSTVKWYLNEIFSKLHVNSRTQALHRAKELNLL